MHPKKQRRSTVESLERRFLLSTVTYNRTAAVAYATQYWDEVVGDGWFWISGSTEKQYTPGSAVPVNASGEADGIGDDCAHFVSSCIGTPPGGGGGGLTIPSRTSSYGEPAAGRLDALLVSDGYAVQVSSVSQLQPGDVIGYDWDGDSGGSLSNSADIDHTAIYMGNGLVDAHSTSHSEADWTLGGADYYFFIHITVPSSVPAAPTNTLPANNASISTFTPQLSASAFSESGGTQSASEWQILSGTTVIYDSGTDTKDLTSLTVPSGKLSDNTAYTWQVRYEDNSSNWSSYSTATKFTVTVGPNTPVNSSPTNGTSVYNPVTLTGGAFSDTQAGTTHTATEWLVKNSSGTTVFDSGTDATDLLSVSVPSSDLPTGQTYTWQVRYEDNLGYWSPYSTATSFSIPSPGALTLSASSAYYLQDSPNGQSLNVWNATTDTGAPNQTISLSEITTIIIDGAISGSNITVDFTNGNPSPQNRVTVLASGSSANNLLNILGSAAGNDTVSFMTGQFNLNSTVIAYSDEGAASFTPGTGTDSLAITGGYLRLGTTASGNVNLSSLSVGSGATLDIGDDMLTLSYTPGNDPESAVAALISSGYNNNTWNGTGIISSLVAANPAYSAIGYYDTNSAILIRPTWKGDANCDGVINADDLSIMALGKAKNATDWSAGNFNYGTQITADDWIIFNYAVAYSNGRNYDNVFAPGLALGSSSQMSQLLA